MNCLCRPSRTLSVRIVLLDETDFMHEIKDDLSGQSLLDVVFGRLNLIETAYFGLRYLDDENQTHWVDPATRISRQLRGSMEIYDMYFGVKFYAVDPTKLIEEITRYQLFLQVKQDVLQGRLPVSFELATELGAFIIQSELGDYDARRHSIGYVSEFRLVANQTRDMEQRVTELHQQLAGMSPSSAELNYLDKVKWHDMYGVDLHPVLGEDSVEYYLGLTPSGIVVLRNKSTVAYYYWPRIAKVYFKGRFFMLRVCDKNNDVSTYGFETPRKSACRHLWRCCVEHHAFFRLVRVAPVQSPDGSSGSSELFSLGSRFRYSGRTEKQAARDAAAFGRSPPIFKRMPSRRQPRRMFEELLENVKSLQDLQSMGAAAGALSAETKSVSIPQLAQQFDSPYRSTCNVPTSLSLRQYPLYDPHAGGRNAVPDSPRSTRSAPWSRTQQKGLFGAGASPRSVRSATIRKSSTGIAMSGGGGGAAAVSTRFRSSSVESQSSNDSRSCKKHRHKGRRTSDNESELSRGSGRSHRKHRRQRSRHRRNESGSDNESSRARSFSGHRRSAASVELQDSQYPSQWSDAQSNRRAASDLSASNSGLQGQQQQSISRSSPASSKHQNDTDSHSHGSSHHRSRRHKKNRELAKHLQFDLVETAGMTEDQLREIPYTVVETHHNHHHHHHHSSSNTASGKRPMSNNSLAKVHKSNITKDRVDRIRGIYVPETSQSKEPIVNGSIRSASTMSSRDCERNSSLVRMMSSLSMGDFISPSGSCLSPLDESGLRVSHEHTDSGLGADQDYAYSSERSSDSTKYGTNKSSGTSVTSGHHPPNPAGHHPTVGLAGHNHQQHSHGGPGGKTGLFGAAATVHESVSNRKPPVHPNHPPIAQQPMPAAATSLAGSRQSIVAPVHSSNNRLFSNTTFQNNQYTFSLSRDTAGGGVGGGGSVIGVTSGGLSASGLDTDYTAVASGYTGFGGSGGGGGYPDARPMSSASPYSGPAGRASRGTKSDIGLSTGRRPSTSSSSTGGASSRHPGRSSSRASTRSHHQPQQQQHQQHHQQHQLLQQQQKLQHQQHYLNLQRHHHQQQQLRQHSQQHLPSVKSEFLLSYLSQSAQLPHSGDLPASPYSAMPGGGGGVQPATSDYLENYKASLAEHNALRMLGTRSSATDVQYSGAVNHPAHRGVSRTVSQPRSMQPQLHSASRQSKQQGGSVAVSSAKSAVSSVGPLLYLDSPEAAERAMSRHQQQQQQQQKPVSTSGSAGNTTHNPSITTTTATTTSTSSEVMRLSEPHLNSGTHTHNYHQHHHHHHHHPQSSSNNPHSPVNALMGSSSSSSNTAASTGVSVSIVGSAGSGAAAQSNCINNNNPDNCNGNGSNGNNNSNNRGTMEADRGGRNNNEAGSNSGGNSNSISNGNINNSDSNHNANIDNNAANLAASATNSPRSSGAVHQDAMRSNSLELILRPIIQSSRRAQ